MFGQAHDQAGILIEPKPEYAIDIHDEDQLIRFRNLLWLVHSSARYSSTGHIPFLGPL